MKSTVAHDENENSTDEKTHIDANPLYDVENFSCLLAKMCEEIYLIHTRAKLKWDECQLVTNSCGFTTGMTRELIAVQLPAVFRIHDILVWIRIRIRGSMPLTNGSGYPDSDPDPDPGSGSCYFSHWPSRCQKKTNFLTQFFLLVTYWRYIYIIF
jgi:hypothetical protein